MVRCSLCLTFVTLLSVAAVPSSHQKGGERSLRLGGTPLQVLAARGSLWVLICDRRCGGEARRSTGRIVRIDPRSARVVRSAALSRPGAIAVGDGGVYVTDFWRDTVRRIDPGTLQVVAALKLTLPFRFMPRDNSFLPEAVAAGQSAIWVATERGVLARTDPLLRHVVATARLPFDAFGGMAVGSSAVWMAESLAGVYRVDTRTNRVAARIRIHPATGGFDAGQIFASGGRILVVGDLTQASVATNRNGLARIDTRLNRVEGVTPLPAGALAVTAGAGSLWLARLGGSTVARVDARTGRIVARSRARVGTALAFEGGHLWTASRDGTIRQLGIRG